MAYHLRHNFCLQFCYQSLGRRRLSSDPRWEGICCSHKARVSPLQLTQTSASAFISLIPTTAGSMRLTPVYDAGLPIQAHRWRSPSPPSTSTRMDPCQPALPQHLPMRQPAPHATLWSSRKALTAQSLAPCVTMPPKTLAWFAYRC